MAAVDLAGGAAARPIPAHTQTDGEIVRKVFNQIHLLFAFLLDVVPIYG